MDTTGQIDEPEPSLSTKKMQAARNREALAGGNAPSSPAATELPAEQQRPDVDMSWSVVSGQSPTESCRRPETNGHDEGASSTTSATSALFQPQTVSPSDTLRTLPLPIPSLPVSEDHAIYNRPTDTALASGTTSSADAAAALDMLSSRDDALHALRLVVRFFEHQPDRTLSVQERVVLDGLMERLESMGPSSAR